MIIRSPSNEREDAAGILDALLHPDQFGIGKHAHRAPPERTLPGGAPCCRSALELAAMALSERMHLCQDTVPDGA